MKFLPFLLILLVAATRLVPHPENIAPITAMALFGGVYLPKKYAFIVPIGAMLISDYFIGFYGREMFFVYGSFLLSGVIGLWLRKNQQWKSIIGGTLLSSVLFYLITNFGVWLLPHSSYSKDLSGLMQSYTMAIPFFRNSLLGDIGYTLLLFGSYQLLQRSLKNIRHNPIV